MTAEAIVQPPRGRATALLRRWFGVPLWKRILLALALGILAGWLLGPSAMAIKWIGDLFVRLIQMLVAPLVFVIIVSGIAALGDVRKLGSIGVRTLGLFVVITAIAVALGLALGTWLKPGLGVSLVGAESAQIKTAAPFAEQMLSIVPLNPIRALAETQMLSIIFFALFLGVGILVAGPKGKPLATLFDSGTAVLLRLVQFVMELAPFAVFALIAAVVGTSGFASFANVLRLGLGVVIGSAIQTLIVHGSLVRFGARLPLLPFFRGSSDAILIGFSTASSSATLPVAMAVAERNLGIGQPVFSTVLPLGATMSMDGTALYMALLSTFAAQAFGVPLGASEYLLLLVTITAVAMGTAPIPSASLFLMVAVLSGIGIGPEQTALLVGFILPFDRPLDMTRTIPNVTSDLATAVAVARWEGELDVERYKST